MRCNTTTKKNIRRRHPSPTLYQKERTEGDWLLRSRWSLRLTPFPSARRGGLNKRIHAQEVDTSTIFVFLW